MVSVPSTDEARCTACGLTFENRQEQVSHYRLDWHRYNLKRKLNGLSCIGEDDFEALSGENIHGKGYTVHMYVCIHIGIL